MIVLWDGDGEDASVRDGRGMGGGWDYGKLLSYCIKEIG